MSVTIPTLRELSCGAKLGVAGFVLVILGGMLVSGVFLYQHYRPRDEKPDLSMTDFKGAYHGAIAESSLLGALNRGHPQDLPQPKRDALLKWLKGDKVAENYDNIDLGENSPSEIFATSCLSCHSRKAPDSQAAAKKVLLDYWEDIKPLAFSKQIQPADFKILLLSAHAHTLSLAVLGLCTAGLLGLSTWPRRLTSTLIGAMGVCLFADLGSWFLARKSDAFVYLIVGGGTIFAAAVVLSCLLILADLARPRPR